MGGLFLMLLGGAAVIVWVLSRIAKAGGSDEAFSRRGRIALTVVLVAMLLYAAFSPSVLSPFIILTAAIPLSLLWTPHLVDWALRPLWSAFDGGTDPVEPRPFYHRASALRKRGEYPKAVLEIEAQLEQFPNDFEGMMLLAEVRSDDLRDIPAAIGTLEEILVTEGRKDRDKILALNRIADLQLRLEDRDAARATLEQIPRTWPGTEPAHFAEQRLSHLPGAAQLAAKRVTPTVALRQYDQNIGLQQNPGTIDAPFESATEQANRLVKRLSHFPDDWEAREQLATVYALHLGRLDLAVMEMNTLIENSKLPPKAVVRWLNQLADLQLKAGEQVSVAASTLRRIVDRFPDSAHSETAQSRISRLGLEIRGKEERPRIKVGTYEQNIGLKYFDNPAPPTPPPAGEKT